MVEEGKARDKQERVKRHQTNLMTPCQDFTRDQINLYTLSYLSRVPEADRRMAACSLEDKATLLHLPYCAAESGSPRKISKI